MKFAAISKLPLRSFLADSRSLTFPLSTRTSPSAPSPRTQDSKEIWDRLSFAASRSPTTMRTFACLSNPILTSTTPSGSCVAHRKRNQRLRHRGLQLLDCLSRRRIEGCLYGDRFAPLLRRRYTLGCALAICGEDTTELAGFSSPFSSFASSTDVKRTTMAEPMMPAKNMMPTIQKKIRAARNNIA